MFQYWPILTIILDLSIYHLNVISSCSIVNLIFVNPHLKIDLIFSYDVGWLLDLWSKSLIKNKSHFLLWHHIHSSIKSLQLETKYFFSTTD